MAGQGVGAPSGTLTFLFTDVEGSTRLWAADAEAMSEALRVHDAVLRETIASYSGHVFSTAGDSYAAAFSRASVAVECATAIQDGLALADWGAGPQLRVRVGLHLGEAEERDGDYFGPALNLAARVMSAAHGGQCVVTETVRDAARIKAIDLGLHQLRDIEVPVHVFQIGAESFPPLWSMGTGIVSLPFPRTSLVGRIDEVNTVRRLVAEHALVTLTGVGGCGKTRLAIEVAHQEVPTHPDGVWFVDLAAIADDTAVAGAFAAALDLVVAPGADPVAQIETYLAPRDALVVVDNCEHVVDDVADLLDGLLERCPKLHVLATSRESLEIDGEYAWKVPSLGTGEDSTSLQLFVDRAGATGATIPADAAAIATMVDIVERLDGIPLAIELAAGRARSMDLDEIRDRLDDRFRFLSGGKRRSRQRQATLEAAVQWSYDLLDEREQSLLRCLSVFQGGFAPGDVCAIAGIGDLEAIDLVDTLAAKSLIDITRDGRGHVRHRLLETIRLFALARLIDAGDVVTVRDRHLDHFYNDRVGSDLEDWLDTESLWRIDREYENYRAAATWALERDRAEVTVRIAAIISDAASPRGETQMILDWLRLPVELAPRDRAYADTRLAFNCTVVGDVASALPVAEHAVEVGLEHALDDVVFAMQTLAIAVWFTGDIARRDHLLAEGRRIACESCGANVRAAAGMFQLPSLYTYHLVEALELADASLADSANMGYRHILEAYRAWILLRLGRIDEAQQAVERFSPIPPSSQWEQMNLITAHAVMAHSGDVGTATKSYATAARELAARRPQIVGDLLVGFGYLAYARGDETRSRELTIGISFVRLRTRCTNAVRSTRRPGRRGRRPGCVPCRTSTRGHGRVHR